jgi:RNA polymerase sigma-70 factor (ECF subfamily)
MDVDSETAARIFEEYRRLVTGVAYRILGSWTDAEDLVQEVWLRWEGRAGEVDSAERWLRRVTVRAAIDRLRRLQQRRETYPGSWLPEPVSELPNPADVAVDRDTLSVGMLLVLETLSPLERAVFVLRQAFAWSPEEIAEVVGRSAAAVRRLDHRARQHVTERRPRYGSDEATARATAETFLRACLHGDVTELLTVLAPDVVLHSDAGGEAKAPRRPILGARKVAMFMAAIGSAPLPEETTVAITPINGRPGIVVAGAQGAFSSMCLDVDADGLITALYLMAAPSKLTHLTGPVE